MSRFRPLGGVDEDSVRLEAGSNVVLHRLWADRICARRHRARGHATPPSRPPPKDIYVSKSLSDSPTEGSGQKRSTGNGRKSLAAAPAEATEIRKDDSSGSERQGERGRSVRQRRKSMPLPLSRPSSGTGAFGQRDRERVFGEVAIFHRGLAGDRPRQQCSGRIPEKVPDEVARFPPEPDPPRRRKPCLHGRGIRP